MPTRCSPRSSAWPWSGGAAAPRLSTWRPWWTGCAAGRGRTAGDGPQSRIARVMPMIVEHGAAVIALTIDEQGQARTAEWKLAVATRLIEDLTSNWGMQVCDIIVDCLTFPIATGQEETRRDAIETIDAIRELKRRFPEVQTTLGVSNVSFGLNPAARAVLNSVFLAEGTAAGMASPSVHAARFK